ncbi:uncharacterized protein STEHIDRAFT_159226 [Stereum hirsutum FP-91666 SS1]|uniref:uncharacterized protein n=1 Tax=Stereum hirsutum (strain FP-91666) TaxID=721885 RepID=UPI00044493CE|nr:uncharacterized protein STEHIDRAFT_159226 [Stereum hirsutum FP-91666 SS1]EIM84561.1 hypothetical protein STEHIDRAFT_159226 [Stereum hirsutum FP-91666 SS1]
MATHISQGSQRRVRRVNTIQNLGRVVLPTSESIPTSYPPLDRFHPILSAIPSVECLNAASTDDEDRHTSMNIVPPLHAQTQFSIRITDSIHLVDSSNLSSSFDDLFGQRDIDHGVSIPSTHAATDTLKPSIHKVATPPSDTAMAPSDAATPSTLDVSDHGAGIAMADNVTNAASAPSSVHGRSTRRVVVVLNGDSYAISPEKVTEVH